MNSPAPVKKKKTKLKVVLLIVCVLLVQIAVGVTVILLTEKPSEKQSSQSSVDDDDVPDFIKNRPQNAKELNEVADRVNAETALRDLASTGIIPPLNEETGVLGFDYAPMADEDGELVFNDPGMKEELTQEPSQRFGKAFVVSASGNTEEIVPSEPLSSVDEYDYIIQYVNYPTRRGEQDYHQTVYKSGGKTEDGGTVTRKVVYTTTYVFVIDVHTGKAVHIHKVGTTKPPLYDNAGTTGVIITSVASDWALDYIHDKLVHTDNSSSETSDPQSSSDSEEL